MKKKFRLLLLIYLSFFFSCQEKDVELELIEKDSGPTPAAAQKESFQNEPETSGKPLISILPSDTVQILVRQDGAPRYVSGRRW
jgi:hypothetical protein